MLQNIILNLKVKTDLTKCEDIELSLQVFSNKHLFDLRCNAGDLFSALNEIYIYTDNQKAKLIEDLIYDLQA